MVEMESEKSQEVLYRDSTRYTLPSETQAEEEEKEGKQEIPRGGRKSARLPQNLSCH